MRKTLNESNIMQLDSFTRAYIECALWSSMDNANEQGGEPLDKNYSQSDIAPETLAEMIADCARFQSENSEALKDYPSENAGHDFWLTRNGHGAGFWENDFGTEADCEKLTAACEEFKEFDLYVGDDGLIYA